MRQMTLCKHHLILDIHMCCDLHVCHTVINPTFIRASSIPIISFSLYFTQLPATMPH